MFNLKDCGCGDGYNGGNCSCLLLLIVIICCCCGGF